MAEEFTSYKIENDAKFRASIKVAQAAVGDLTIPLTLISKDFYRSEKAIFRLKSQGQYPDFKTKDGVSKYKEFKLRTFGFAYPLLKAKGRLEGSVTDPTHSDAYNQILNKSILVIGTQVPYGVYHQSDRPRSKIPLRKFLFIGPESSFANSDQKGRLERWMNIMQGFVMQKLKG